MYKITLITSKYNNNIYIAMLCFIARSCVMIEDLNFQRIYQSFWTWQEITNTLIYCWNKLLLNSWKLGLNIKICEIITTPSYDVVLSIDRICLTPKTRWLKLWAWWVKREKIQLTFHFLVLLATFQVEYIAINSTAICFSNGH